MTGAVPNTRWLDGCVIVDDKGFVKTGPELSSDELASANWPLARTPYLLETSRPRIFAVGDVRGGNINASHLRWAKGQSRSPSFIKCFVNSWIMPNQTCTHIEQLSTVKRPTRRECQECVKMGGTWIHLRTCQACGGTYCCDSSPHRHATKHARATGHPVIASAEPDERWLYCYPDDQLAEY